MTTDVLERLARLEQRVSELEQACEQTLRPRIGITIEEFLAKRDQPAERSLEVIEQFKQLFGSFSGPADLSSNMRDYLYGDKE
jgi:hypothetical protein